MSKNTKNETASKGPGRPKAEVKLPRGNKFTIAQIHEANPGVKAMLTIRNAVKDMVDSGILVKSEDVIKRDGPGRPTELFVRKAVLNAAKANLKKAKAPKLTPATPAVDMTPAPVAAPATEPVTA